MNFLSVLSLSGVFCLSVTVPAFGAIANFDSLPEGTSGFTITDNGITFSDFIAGLRVDAPELVVASEDELAPPFSLPNYLTSYGSISEVGPDFGAFGSVKISTSTQADSVSLDLFTDTLLNPDSEVVLDAYLDGTLVGSTSTTLAEFTPTQPGVLHYNLSLSGILFDHLQLYTPEAFADGVIYLGIDNVDINTDVVPSGPGVGVPEPMTLLGTFTTGFLGLFFKGKSL